MGIHVHLEHRPDHPVAALLGPPILPAGLHTTGLCYLHTAGLCYLITTGMCYLPC